MRARHGRHDAPPKKIMTKPKLMTIDLIHADDDGREMLLVIETDNTPYGDATINRSGYYNMSLAYWLREEYPAWSQTASIYLHPGDNDSIKIA